MLVYENYTVKSGIYFPNVYLEKKKDKVNLIFKQKITSSVLLQISILLCNSKVKGKLIFVKNRK